MASWFVIQFALAEWGKNSNNLHFAIYASCMPSPCLYAPWYRYITPASARYLEDRMLATTIPTVVELMDTS